MVHCLPPRHLGDKSTWQPYLDALPTHVPTPLNYTPAEMRQLRGTTLHDATKHTKQQLIAERKHLEALVKDAVVRMEPG